MSSIVASSISRCEKNSISSVFTRASKPVEYSHKPTAFCFIRNESSSLPPLAIQYIFKRSSFAAAVKQLAAVDVGDVVGDALQIGGDVRRKQNAVLAVLDVLRQNVQQFVAGNGVETARRLV